LYIQCGEEVNPNRITYLFLEEISSFVYDLGSAYCRVGNSGEDAPKLVVEPVNYI
jgi:hypothetical protein